MTGFANAKGASGAFTWAWELRGVNGKGLDLRLRVPDWISGLETGVRSALSENLHRGNISLNLKLSREESAGRVAVNAQALEDTLAALETIEAAALGKGVTLAPATAADVMSARGVLETAIDDAEDAELSALLLNDLAPVIEAFDEMRTSEGSKLALVLSAQIDEIERLTHAAGEVVERRKTDIENGFREALSRVTENAPSADEPRVSQELALIAVKSDVTEELDRLQAHVAAARDLLAGGSPVGRKLDFLAQEFNREANTLCSKAQHTELTQVGLELKTVIDQMREQVQNVE
jgi:uncharacterized protein (TIGR00255 family)